MKHDLGKNVLLLIDGNALIHRSYHGLPPLKTKSGLLVNAVYGFTSSVLSAIKEFDPKYIVVAFDVAKKTFRNEKYSEYKAHREKMDDELASQFPLVKNVCEALNFTQIGIKGYEADDVIGTISDMIHKKCKDVKTIIVTGDMDALQLVDDKKTFVWSVARGVRRAELFDENAVKQKYGFEPERLIDYKSLRGDASDNIPGVKGVGDKGAKDLILNFGDLENIYNNLDSEKIKPRTKKLLNDDKKNAFMSKELATIYKEVPLEFGLEGARVNNYDKNKAIKLFEEYEFKSLIHKLPEEKSEVKQNSLF